jgi:hypothetical protein
MVWLRVTRCGTRILLTKTTEVRHLSGEGVAGGDYVRCSSLSRNRVTANGNQLVSCHTETRIADAGIFYPITSSTELGELYQQSFAEGRLNVFGASVLAIETEGEHAAQGGAIAHSVCGKRVVNFTSGQGVLYGV